MKFAVRTIKNQFHPLKVADDANIKQGEYVIVKTDKGEEVFRVEIVNKLKFCFLDLATLRDEERLPPRVTR